MSMRPLGGGGADTPTLHLLTGARALDALDPVEAQAFDDHLDSCPTCAEEYRGLQETAALLGAAEAVTAPDALRVKVMQAVRQTPQLPPVVADKARRSLWRRTSTYLVAAALVAIATVGTVLAVRMSDQGPMTAQQCVAQASDVVTRTPAVGDGGSMRTSASCGYAVVDLPAMPTPAAGRGYQLWLIDSSGAHSLGMVRTAADGTVAPTSLTTPVKGGDVAVGVTVEPASGSTQPTSKPLWQVNF